MNLLTFPILILVGRPASGKSEIIQALQNTPAAERRQRYHLAELDVLDDFPMLWTWFEEDHLLSKVMGKPRLHTNDDGYFKYPYLWHLLIERFNLEYQKHLRDESYHQHTSLIIEFSRGSEHGGYIEAIQHLSDDILRCAAMLYVNVSFEESLRKNRRRYNPARPDSILEHALPDDRLERLYRYDDWLALTAGDPEYIVVRSMHVPYVIFENEDDVTTAQPAALATRLETTLDRLWKLRTATRH